MVYNLFYHYFYLPEMDLQVRVQNLIRNSFWFLRIKSVYSIHEWIISLYLMIIIKTAGKAELCFSLDFSYSVTSIKSFSIVVTRTG